MIIASELYAIAPGHVPSRMPGKFSRARADTYATVEIVGELDKAVMLNLRTEISRLAASASIGAICLLIDSPGGTVAGTADLAATVARAAKVKPVHAFIEDLGASAAYWIASQATTIACNSTAYVGSIGVYRVVISEARLMERIGVDVYIVRSGAHKGATVEGAKITPEQLAELQARVDAVARIFIADVARGRRMGVDRVAEIADGRVFVGAAAKAAGLVDRVCMFEDLVAEIQRASEPTAWAKLAGEPAWRKFRELVSENVRLTRQSEVAAEWDIRRAHPELVAAADEWHSRRESGASSRWGHLPVSEQAR